MQKIYSKLLLFKFSIPCIFFQFSSLQNIKKYTCAYYCLNLLLFESFLSCSIFSLIYANRAERLFYFLLINASMHQTSKIKVGFSSSAMPPPRLQLDSSSTVKTLYSDFRLTFGYSVNR